MTSCLLCATGCRYSDDVTYGELFLQNEYEMSCYNLDEADVAEQRKRFNLYEAEVRGKFHFLTCSPSSNSAAHCPARNQPTAQLL